MRTQNELNDMITALTARLLGQRPDGGMWQGRLSSSAVSTAVSVFALYLADREVYASQIRRGADWLLSTMLPDGTWGDSPESPPNLTATLLTYACLSAVAVPPQQTMTYLQYQFGGTTDQHIIRGVLAYYGNDFTFSVPILTMCALAGIIRRWNEIPQLPFELSVLPQRLFRLLNLPVVSYAIPALIAVGILRYQKGKRSLLAALRRVFIPSSLKVLTRLQPSHGGFLEAAPLTAFVSMCMIGAGYREHETTRKAIRFLVNTVRTDGSWPIDTNLSGWVTALSVRALDDDLPDKQALATIIRKNAFTCRHPFTGAKEGGWGWTNLPGAVPDADDTSGALVALHILQEGAYSFEVGKGIEWLLALQNSDGGMPTFCKGWGRLPFDRSCPDITAHAFLAFTLWMDVLPEGLKQRCRRSSRRMLHWLDKVQTPEGSWLPLWFGDQQATDEHSPVYGTATVVEYLAVSSVPLARQLAERGCRYLLSAQHSDGGWGGAPGVSTKVTLTARTLSALATAHSLDTEAMEKAFDYLRNCYESGELYRTEPIGLYFARLWYSEELYNITFALRALKSYSNLLNIVNENY